MVLPLTLGLMVLQTPRLRRALHVFQLEGYKPGRLLAWCSENRVQAIWLASIGAKKPLVMTGRAWRILVMSTALSVAVLLLGAWLGQIAWMVAISVVLLTTQHFVIAADLLLTPVQTLVNGRYLRAARRKLDDIAPLVVGVTGSFGKTSTKFAIRDLIGSPGSALATPGSYNTPLGVCRAINEHLEPAHRFLIVEMGAYREGDIAELCRFVRPTVGVLTAIGPAHLERFGSLDAIARAKYEIVASLPADGTAVVNVDDPTVRALADDTSHVRVVRYGLDAAGRPDVTATDADVTASSTMFTVVAGDDSARVTTRLLGRHAISNVLAGVAVSLVVGWRLDDLVGPIADLVPVEHRLQVIAGTGGITVIDDAYNSNPDGAAAALEVLAATRGGRKVVVTPGMIELGDVQYEANRRLGRSAAQIADTLIVVAEVNRAALVDGAALADGAATVVTVASLAEASEKLRTLLAPGDVVLFENDLPDQYEA